MTTKKINRLLGKFSEIEDKANYFAYLNTAQIRRYFVKRADLLKVIRTGQSIQVIEPQMYDKVSTLTKKDLNVSTFKPNKSDIGYFYHDNTKDNVMVTGSGADPWIKVTGNEAGIIEAYQKYLKQHENKSTKSRKYHKSNKTSNIFGQFDKEMKQAAFGLKPLSIAALLFLAKKLKDTNDDLTNCQLELKKLRDQYGSAPMDVS